MSIINYLSAVWVLHKIYGYKHVDPKTFEIHMTLRGILRSLGDKVTQARPLSVHELLRIFNTLNLDSSEDLAFWCSILLCFRGLLRKSNVVEEGLALLVGDVEFYPWGVLVRIRRSKTISYKERVLEIPFSKLPASPFCVYTYLSALLTMVNHSQEYQLISYVKIFGCWAGFWRFPSYIYDMHNDYIIINYCYLGSCPTPCSVTYSLLP